MDFGQFRRLLSDIESLLLHGEGIDVEIRLHDGGLLHLDDFLNQLLEAKQKSKYHVKDYGADHASGSKTDLSHLFGFGPFAEEIIKSGYTGEKEKEPPLHAIEKMPKSSCGILIQPHGGYFSSDRTENTEMTDTRRASKVRHSIGAKK